MINLFVEYFIHSNPIRAKEIDFCLIANLYQLSALDHIFIITHNKEETKCVKIFSRQAPVKSTIIELDIPRPTYGELFSLIHTHSEDDDVNILSNSDIVFDSTIRKADCIKEDQIFAITRWDWTDDGLKLFNKPKISQDAWILRGKPRSCLFEINFTTGVPACDNVILGHFFRCEYKVKNPCRDIIIKHVHDSDIHDYQWSKRVQGQGYFIEESSL